MYIWRWHLDRNISSTKSDNNIRTAKARTTIDRLPTICESFFFLMK